MVPEKGLEAEEVDGSGRGLSIKKQLSGEKSKVLSLGRKNPMRKYRVRVRNLAQ